ncbi:MAG: Kef-type K+ transport system membrane component KefB [Saprospiraceae bacterium]|jgi:Kef-type K+ transport system membrane component KefB|tara:strand:+ start:170 stop:550 length:381 start_codon:yes stop_codon:yes gene_type:complete
MSLSRFFILFGITLIGVFGLLYLLSLTDKMGYYIDISYFAVPAFSLLSVVVYFLTIFLERKPEKQVLLNIVIINVLLKFFISALIIGLYYNMKEPDDGIFVVPFITVYVAFTIFETYFMSEQARAK